MQRVEPQVFLIGETKVRRADLDSYLSHLGVAGWKSDATADAEEMIEVMGRLCYRSFEPGLNANVSKVREHNSDYLNNIVNVKHGSVLEHSFFNFIFSDVSRVFTHELVRHRAGTAISQESLRFVRLENLKAWFPSVVRENDAVMQMFTSTFGLLEQAQLQLAKLYDLDSLPMKTKKIITSAMRRIAPIGLATTIGWSANARALRWILEMRTAPEAEEEIRLVFGKVGERLTSEYPNLFGDFQAEQVAGHAWWRPMQSKV